MTRKRKTCASCRAKVVYNDTWDAFYCEYCNAWLEGKCNDPHCDICPGRPDKPLKAPVRSRNVAILSGGAE